MEKIFTMNKIAHKMKFTIFTILILFTTTLFQDLRAQSTRLIGETNPDSAMYEALQTIPGEPLTLERATELALREATTIGEARADLQAAFGAVKREKGQFDPELFLEGARTEEDVPSASPFAGANVLKTKETAALGGAKIKLSVGTEIEASLGTTRFETNSSFAAVNPQYSADGIVSIRQPLLAGFSATARRDLTVAERNLAATQALYNDTVLRVKATVEIVYWDLFTAERNYAVQKLIKDQAEAFVKETETRARTGLVGPIQVANAKVFLAEQELSLIDIEEELDRRSDQLASLLGKRPKDLPRFRTVDSPKLDFPVEPIESLVENALRENYQIQALRHQTGAIQALARAAKWEVLPSLDLIGTLGGRGLSGNGRDIIFGSDTLRTNYSGGMGDALNQVWGGDFPNWTVGFNLSIPIGFRADRGEYDRLVGEINRSEQIYIAAKRTLEEQIRASHRALANGMRRLKAAQDGVAASEEQVRIGIIDFRNGRTTAFELVRLGADLASAEERYSIALVRNAKAAALLHQLTSGSYPPSNQ
jgi:outer membrane protein TolC